MHEAQPVAALLEPRRSEEIYATEGGWFRARWHFSFGHYHDPENMGIGSLRVLNHDSLTPGSVWPMHAHRDVEGITYVVAGEFEHADSLGNGGVLRAGGVQRMRLGSGAEHSEGNHSPDREMQFVQIWILPRETGLAPSLVQRQYEEADRLNRMLQVVKPEGTAEVGLDVAQEARIYVSRLEDGASLEHTIPFAQGGYLYVIQGRLEVNGEALASGDAAYIRSGGNLRFSAAVTSELLLVETAL